LSTNIHQPLGKKNRRSAIAGKPSVDRSRKHLKMLTGLSLSVVIAAVGGWVAWQSQLPRPVKPTLEAASAGQPDGLVTATVPGEQAGDIQIIGNSDAASANGTIQRQSGRSGAEIATVFDGSGSEISKYTPKERSSPGPVILSPHDRVGQDIRLAHLPDPAIMSETQDGVLPVVGNDGERAFDIYARPWSGARGTRIAILVGGLGLSQTGTQYAIATLPEEVTLAFAANGNSLKRWMQEARRQGREIMLQVPFEPFDYPRNDPGRGTLTVDAGAEQNLADLHAAMGKITNYTGITNFMGGRFLATPEALEPVMRDLATRGIMFLDDGTSARSLTEHYSKTFGIPFAGADVVLDDKQERGRILEKLDDLERIARRNGTAVGVASAFEVSVDTIKFWIQEAKSRGIEIVGVSAVAIDPGR